MGRVEIFTGRDRRRSWSDEEKLRLLSEADACGISLAEVARRHDVCPQQLYAWRSAFRRTAEAVESVAFLPVEVSAAPPAKPERLRRRTKPVEVALANGRCLRVDAEIDPGVLRRLVQALEA